MTKFAYVPFCGYYYIPTLNVAYLDDPDRVAEAIQRRAHLGSPEDGFHGSRDPARIAGNRGSGGGPDAGEEQG